MTTKDAKTPLFFGVVFFLSLYLLWLMAKQMIGPIIFGAILAGVFFPLNLNIEKKLKISRNLASCLTCLLICILVLMPSTLIIANISKEAVHLYQNIVTGLEQKNVNDFFFGDGLFAKIIKQFPEYFNINIELSALKEKLLNLTKGATGNILLTINGLIGNLFTFIFDIMVMMVVTFGLLIKGEILKNYAFELSPLPYEQEQTILSKFNQMNYVTLVCNGIGGVIQGVAAGVAFWLVGIESVMLWTILMILLAFIPLVGISLVTVPAGLYLMLTNQVAAGVGLLIFTSLVGLLVENWFKPKFIGGRIQIDSTFVLLTIIGGMGLFGMAGIFYGPIIGILFITLVELYHNHYKVH